MTGRVFKVCGCREDGKQLGVRCPRLRAKGHGTWAFVVDDGKGENGKRRQVKRAGFATKKDAVAALEEARGDIKAGRRLNDKTTVGEWLDHWLAEKSSSSGVSSSGRILRESTRAVYAQHIRDYLRPTLGRVRLRQLTPDDISKAYRRVLIGTPPLRTLGVLGETPRHE